MDGNSTRFDYAMLDSSLLDPYSEPQRLPLEYLWKITNGFSDEWLLGKGSFGWVYKGVLQTNSQPVAVKKLVNLKPGVEAVQFENEVFHLMKVKNPNIVRLLGYCYETQNECVEHNGKYIFAEMQQKLLCLEYLPNGSLYEHLSGESLGHDWHTRYKIIKGICQGLHYLHEECKCRMNGSIIHLDLKPANILLDANMVPKIADFGLSELLEYTKTQTRTSNLAGTFGYMAPEYIHDHIITTKADIYSLGVIIIEIMTGTRVNLLCNVTNFQDFIESVLKCWRIRLEASSTYRVDIECQKIGNCMEIGLSCIRIKHNERPTIGEIIEKLNNQESTSCSNDDEEESLLAEESTICSDDQEEPLPEEEYTNCSDDEDELLHEEENPSCFDDKEEPLLEEARKETNPSKQSATVLLPRDRVDSLFSSALRIVWVNGPIIVGAGPSGLAVAACLREQDVPFVMLERADCIASLWQKRTYDRLKLQLPKQSCELPRMPFPDHYPEYPTRRQFIDYLEDYSTRFQIMPKFNNTVLSARYDEASGLWRVRTSVPVNGDIEYIGRWLVVATGVNAESVVPDIPGLDGFDGKVTHVSDYKCGEAYRGKRVLVVGCGNSGMDVSVDLCDHGARPAMVMRDAVHVLPRKVLGKPIVVFAGLLMCWLPLWLVDMIMVLLAWLVLGDLAKFGLRRPVAGPLEHKKTHGRSPVLDNGAVARIRAGDIAVVPAVKRFYKGGQVEFADGRAFHFDTVILATGYRSNVPRWLKANDFFNEDGYPRTAFPHAWKGQSGLYAVGFTGHGLYGSSADAMRIAKDIGNVWRKYLLL